MHHTPATEHAPEALALREQLSALMDGECSREEAQALSQALDQVPGWQHTWQDYDAVGCALRAHAGAVHAAPLTVPSAFVEGVMARVHAESKPQDAVVSLQALQTRVAANASVFRWKLVASVASLAAVLSVSWQVVGVGAPSAQMAAAPTEPASPVGASAVVWQQVQTPQGTVWRNPEVEALMAAHREHGGMTALQMPAGFLRTATFVSSER